MASESSGEYSGRKTDPYDKPQPKDVEHLVDFLLRPTADPYKTTRGAAVLRFLTGNGGNDDAGFVSLEPKPSSPGGGAGIELPQSPADTHNFDLGV